MAFSLRTFRNDDTASLAQLYRASVRGLGPRVYAARQVEAWARYPEDLCEFGERLSRGLTLLALDGETIAGFGQLQPADHVALLYCAPQYAGRGAASMIYAQLEQTAVEQGMSALTAEASHLARPFFERKGWEVVATELAMRQGIGLERFRMRKLLA